MDDTLFLPQVARRVFYKHDNGDAACLGYQAFCPRSIQNMSKWYTALKTIQPVYAAIVRTFFRLETRLETDKFVASQ